MASHRSNEHAPDLLALAVLVLRLARPVMAAILAWTVALTVAEIIGGFLLILAALFSVAYLVWRKL